MLQGKFVGEYPFIQILIASGDAAQKRYFLLDTGFSGYLCINFAIAKELNIKADNVKTIRLAHGENTKVQSGAIQAVLENKIGDVEVLISDSLPLVGIKFLSLFGCKLTMDCKNRNLFLECI